MQAIDTESTPQVKYLKDYQAPAYFIPNTKLSFDIYDGHTIVKSDLTLHKNSDVDAQDLILDGQELELLAVQLNGETLSTDDYQVSDETLTLSKSLFEGLESLESFELSITTKILPELNTSLEGLYRSRTIYCTQCEAEGFRKITYYLDRPDVMSEFETTVTADAKFSTLLSNGNCISDDTVDGRRTVVWHDPHKKPCYLFALVAGNLEKIQDRFVTQSGREVTLEIFVEAKDLSKCDHAMDSLKRSMKWDEEIYGREYDLDIFMIVAVDDFNMGAMENKGLNIFNTSCVLADPETTTDQGFQRVEAVVAHEYFHNWSGNRVTCRDWFQLSLKEGFTVYRDSEFSADMNSREVKRIEDASFLRAHQFVEDAGPMAHAVRPQSFIEISNFYTLTIYEKGSEVVRMMANILGPERFRSATDLYFDRHDGQAVTCEDFVCAMEDSSGVDLSQFRLWYDQAGTPVVKVDSEYDADASQYQLTLTQSIPDTPGQSNKKPMHIPVKVALLGTAGHFALSLLDQNCEGNSDGNRKSSNDNAITLDQVPADNTEMVLDLTQQKQTFVFERIPEEPVASVLRGFSAPVNLDQDLSPEQLKLLILNDDDGFTRFNAVQQWATNMVADILSDSKAQQDYQIAFRETCSEYIEVVSQLLDLVLVDEAQDPALVAMLMTLPAPAYILEQLKPADPLAIHQSLKSIKKAVANSLSDKLMLKLEQVDLQLSELGISSEMLGGRAIALRSLKQTLLSILSVSDSQSEQLKLEQYCLSLYSDAPNMTERLTALKTLIALEAENSSISAIATLEDFYQRFSDESLVVNMWLQLQACAESDQALEKVQLLMEHEAFDFRNPNKHRALLGGFCTQNPQAFHALDGSGYEFLADQIIALNEQNPQLASRLITPLTHWGKLDTEHACLMKSALKRISEEDNLSKDVFEVVIKSLADKA